MTPKEKANELIEKYMFVYIPNYTSMHEVKQCALLAVDQATDIIAEYEGRPETQLGTYDFWEKVKEEIEKL